MGSIIEEDELSNNNEPDPINRDPIYIQKWIDYS